MNEYVWLRNGCIDDTYFNWMFSLWTAQDDNVRFINENNTAYRKFVSSVMDYAKNSSDRESHYKRFQLVLPTDYIYSAVNQEQHNQVFHPIWKGKIQFL